MKMTMPTTAVEILKQAYLYRQDGFQSERFTELYLDWCKATNYADTDGENFPVYVKVHGEPARIRSASSVSSNTDTRARSRGTNRMMMIKTGDDNSHCDTATVEKYRRELMRKLANGQTTISQRCA